MEKNEKKCQVWMLPTDKADNVPFLRNINGRSDRLYPATKGYYYTQAYLKEQQFEANHLYITSDDEIKEGDWCVNESGRAKEIINCVLIFTGTWGGNLGSKMIKTKRGGIHYCYCKKIIATTDKSLTISEVVYPEELIHPLPQPSESFIQKYIECYNKGEVVKEVMVEYTNVWKDLKLNKLPDVLKINPKDNTITIRKIKDSWNREEVELLCRKAFRSAASNTIKALCPELEDKWIEENL